MECSRFKFRAWNKENKIMHYDAECAYDSMKGTPPLMQDSFGSLLDDDNFIIEQCTGQKDKHGNLIFEGDVLKCGDVSPLLPVSFVDGAFVYTYGNMGNYQLRQEVLVNCEIVGTIHDPEYQDQFRDATKNGQDINVPSKGRNGRMSNLTGLVPPLELCKKIPAGEFHDSVFIWMEVEASATMEKTWSLMQGTPYARQRPNRKIPAPTLEEIIRKIRLDLLCGIEHHGDFYVANRHIGCFEDERAATAALRVWMKLKGVEYAE